MLLLSSGHAVEIQLSAVRKNSVLFQITNLKFGLKEAITFERGKGVEIQLYSFIKLGAR
jgi:hypothetical protein